MTFRTSFFAAALVTTGILGGASMIDAGRSGALAQNPQLNALFDRIVRLEAEVRSIREDSRVSASEGRGLNNGQGAVDVDARISRLEAQISGLSGQIDDLARQIDRMNAARGSREEGQRLHDRDRQAPDRLSDAGGQSWPPLQREPDDPDGDALAALSSQSALTPSGDRTESLERAPGPQILGTIPRSAYEGSNNWSGRESAGGASSRRGGDAPIQLAPNLGGSTGGAGVESVQTTSLDGTNPAIGAHSPEELYERSYEGLLRRDYAGAEQGFRTFLERYGDHELAGNAQYWLGESFYARNEYRQAAEAFLKGYRDHNRSRRAPDSLVRLGMTLARLDQSQQACAALDQVGRDFPDATQAIQLAAEEKQRVGC